MNIIRIAAVLLLPLLAAATIQAQTYLQYADSADNYAGNGKWEAAERCYLSALRLEPGNPSNALILSNLGRVRAELGHHSQAVEDFSIGLSIAPNSTQLLTGRALSLLALGREEEALADLDRALAIDPALPRPRLTRASLLLRAGKTDEAERDFDRLVDQDSTSVDAIYGKARCLIADGRPEEGLVQLRKATSLADDDTLRLTAAILLIDLGRLEEASEEIRHGLKINGMNGDLYLIRAVLHRLRYENEDMETEKKLAVENGADPQLILHYFPSGK